MLKFLKAGLLGAALLGSAGAAHAADVADGEKVFRKCAACHAAGEGAKSRVGPHLNDLFGRQAGTIDGFKYSAAMVAAGFDYLLKVRTTDIAAYRRVLGERISALPNVAQTSTFVVMETVKDR